jgi:hypothetical protein
VGQFENAASGSPFIQSSRIADRTVKTEQAGRPDISNRRPRERTEAGMQKGIIRREVILALVVLIAGTSIAVPLGRYAERDDAPGGVVIAFLIFIVSALLAAWMIKRTET